VTKPAEVNLKGIDKIAIGEITGKGGRELGEDLTHALFQTGRFEVLDREHIEGIMQEHRLSSTGIVDEETAVHLGKLIGTAVLLFGRISIYKYDETLAHSDYKDKKGSHRSYTRKGTAHVTATLQLVNVETGKILAVKKLSSDDLVKTGLRYLFKKTIATSASENSVDKQPEKINPDPLFANARKLIVEYFMKMIAPYTVYETVNFLTDKKIIELQKGFNMAKIGEWDRALESFRKAVDNFPNEAKTHYNLGLAYLCLSDYENAEVELLKAYEIKPVTIYMKGLERCKNLAAEKKKLEDQLEGIK